MRKHRNKRYRYMISYESSKRKRMKEFSFSGKIEFFTGEALVKALHEDLNSSAIVITNIQFLGCRSR